jgi:hypothetical protein
VAVTQVSQTPIHAARILIIHRALGVGLWRRLHRESPFTVIPPIPSNTSGSAEKQGVADTGSKHLGVAPAQHRPSTAKLTTRPLSDTEISAISQSGPIIEPDINKLAACGTLSGCNPPVQRLFFQNANVTGEQQMAEFLRGSPG